MKDNLRLVELSKQVSNGYINDNIPMNETLEKIAEKYSLNKDELHRVAELANVDVYLNLIEKSENKYLNFPLADYNYVYNSLIEKNSNYSKKVSDPYDKEAEEKPFSFSMYKTRSKSTGNPVIDKVASFVPREEINDKLIEADKYKTCIQFLENSAIDVKGEIGSLVDDTYFLVKQACLSGIQFSDIERVINNYCPSLNEYLINFYSENLKNEVTTHNKFFKEAEFTDFKINEDHKLVKNLKTLESKFHLFEKIANTYKHFVEEYNSLVKKYKIGFEKDAGLFDGVIKFIKNNPVLSAGVLAGIGSFILGKQYGKFLERNRPYTKNEIIARMQGYTKNE